MYVCMYVWMEASNIYILQTANTLCVYQVLGVGTVSQSYVSRTFFIFISLRTCLPVVLASRSLTGGVGCGKTFLMDLFFEEMQQQQASSSSSSSRPQNWTLQKIHFHKFMLRVHNEMHLARKEQQQSSSSSSSSDGILPAVVASTVQHGQLLCLDEFQVTDVADSMILQRLFEGLWQAGCVVVATSNRPPDELYLNGLQRDRFLPFIEVLKKHCQVVSMDESQTDYRLVQKDKTGTTRHVYFLGKESRADFNELFYELAGNGNAVAPTSLQTQGRQVPIPLAVMAKCMARFSFEDLCQKALGAADYLVIGQTFHTVFVEKIPALTLNEINWVRRFISFVDCMYECNVKLILQAKTPPELIFQPGSTTGEYDEVFAFDRTVSRLQEMQSQNYLRKKWIRRTEGTKTRKTTLVLEPICP